MRFRSLRQLEGSVNYLIILALCLTACGASMECTELSGTGGATQAAGGQSSIASIDAGSDATVGASPVADAGSPDASPPCVCEYFEPHPSSSAAYIGECGGYGLYDEPSAGYPSDLFVCSGAPQ